MILLLALSGFGPLLFQWYRIGTARSEAMVRLRRKADVLYTYEADLAEWEWEHWHERRVILHHQAPDPQWLWRYVPREWVFGVYHVEFIRRIGRGRDGGIVARVAEDSDLKTLAAFPELRCVDLCSGSHPITDKGLAHLGKLTRLERLSFNVTTGITDAGLAHLGKLRRLEHLAIFVAPGTVTETGLAHLNRLKHLRILHLGGVELTNAGLGRLCKAHPALEKLFLIQTRVSDAGLKHLQALSRLRRLDLIDLPIRGEGLHHLGALPNLLHIRIVDTYAHPTLTGERIRPLEGFRALKTLEVYWGDLGEKGVRRIAALESLNRLALENGAVTDECLAHLKLKELRILSLAGNEITDVGLAELAALPKLEGLDLAGTRISDQGLKELKRFPNLRRLSLEGNPSITDAAVEPLMELERLEYVVLNETAVTDDAIRRLREARPECRVCSRSYDYVPIFPFE